MTDQTMNPEEGGKDSGKLVASLREGVAIIQMIFYKELRKIIAKKNADKDNTSISMLCGAVTNEIFGTRNMDEKFETFRTANLAVIEQLLLSVGSEMPAMRKVLTDALRIQVLCDSQEQHDSSATLTNASQLGILVQDRDIPLPSTFMTIVRTLGEQNQLIVSPVQITPEDDKAMVH